MSELQLLADALDGLIQAKAGFHAHDQQVEHVGQAEANAMLPGFGHPGEHHRRHDVAEQAPPRAIRMFGCTRIGVDSSRNARNATPSRMP